MNRVEAHSLLMAELEAYRQFKLAELVELVGTESSVTRPGLNNSSYSIVVWVRWHDQVGGDIVVSSSITPADWGSPHDRLDESFVVSCVDSMS